MATNIIKIKRTTGTTAPSSLNAGELAFSGGAGTQGNNGQRLFIGDPANSNAVIIAAVINIIGIAVDIIPTPKPAIILVADPVSDCLTIEETGAVPVPV